jgi:hypothetical protein
MRVVPTFVLAACTTAIPIQPALHQEPAREAVSTEATPWFRSWDALGEHERLVRIGANDAAGLEAEYARACGPSSPPTISGSPLLRYRTAGWNTPTGAVVQLSPLAGSPDTLLADIRCHFIGVMLSPFGVDDSPFDLPGLHIDARGDDTEIVLALTLRDSSQKSDLQRRVNRQVDDSARPHHEE